MPEKHLRGLTKTSPWGAGKADEVIELSLDATENFLRELGTLSPQKQDVALRGLSVTIREIRRENREQ